MQRGGIGKSGNESIGMNPPVTIGGNGPQGTGRKGFNIFDSIVDISDFSNRSALWHDKAISEYSVRGRLFKNAGHEDYF